MSTFRAVNDALLVQMIAAAESRIVFIAPGLHLPVAEALVARFRELDRLAVTLVLDGSEEVCRIGFGEIAALQLVHSMANAAGFSIRQQPGLRIGALVVDADTLVWSPTPRAVEATPGQAGDAADTDFAPNGLLLDLDVGGEIAEAVSAEGTETTPDQAEIGKVAITPEQVTGVAKALADNPPIPVDLQRVTRVFSTKLQFVELEVRGAQLSRRKLRLPNTLINVDADGELLDLLDSAFRPFADFKDRKTRVPVFIDGEQAFDRNGNPILEEVSEEKLNRERAGIEKEYLYEVTGFGTLIEKERKAAFLRHVEAFKVRMTTHADNLRALMRKETEQTIDRLVALIASRAAGKLSSEGMEAIKADLIRQCAGGDEVGPSLRCVFKDVTHEQTQDVDFRRRLDRVLPPSVKRRLGRWYDEFSAAKEGVSRPEGQAGGA